MRKVLREERKVFSKFLETKAVNQRRYFLQAIRDQMKIDKHTEKIGKRQLRQVLHHMDTALGEERDNLKQFRQCRLLYVALYALTQNCKH